jgi:hypothetical protein
VKGEGDDEGKGVFIDDYLSDKEYVTEETLGDYVHAYLTDEEHYYVTNAVTGSLDTIYPAMDTKPLADTIGDLTSIHTEANMMTLAETIGAVSVDGGYNEELQKRLPTGNVYSLSGAILALLNIIDELQGEIDE